MTTQVVTTRILAKLSTYKPRIGHNKNVEDRNKTVTAVTVNQRLQKHKWSKKQESKLIQ